MRKTNRVIRAMSLLAASLVMSGSMPLASADHVSNIQVVWTSNELQVVIPAVAWEVVEDAGRIGCAGTVRLTLPTGAQQTVVGVGLGPTACSTQAPCFPYNQLSPTITCTSSTLLNPVYIVVPASADGNVASANVGCLKEFFLELDADGDHEVDSRNGPFFGFANCDHWGE